MSKRQTIEYYCDICSKVYPEIILREITIPSCDQEDNPIQYTDGHICPACDVKLSRYIKQLQQGTYDQKTDYASTTQQQHSPDSLCARIATRLHAVLQMYPGRGVHYAYCGADGHIFTKDTCNPAAARVHDTNQYAPPGLDLIVTDLPNLGAWLEDNADSIPEAFKYAAVDINGVACACVKPPVFTADKDSWDDFPEDTYSIPGVWDARYPGAIYSLSHYREGAQE